MASSSCGQESVFVMKKMMVGAALRERLGDDAAYSFHDYIEGCGETWRSEVITACTERLDMKIERFALREDLIKGFSEIRQEMATLRVELLRWSFAFWLGQVATTAGLMVLLIRLLQ